MFRSPHLQVFFSLQVLGGVLQSLTEEAQKWRGHGLGAGRGLGGWWRCFFSVHCQVFLPINMEHSSWVGRCCFISIYMITGFSLSRCPGSNRVPSINYSSCRERSHIPPVPPVKGDMWVSWKVKSVNRPETKITGTLKCYYRFLWEWPNLVGVVTKLVSNPKRI